MPDRAHAGEAVGVAFLGCGAITRRHASHLRGLGVRTYFASRELSRAESFNRELGGSGAFGSYQQALADARVSCAVVATPPASHLALTLASLDAGKDVVVEKPAFLRSHDADPVRDAATRTGRLVLVAENYHYKPLLTFLRQTIGSGELGEVRVVLVNALKQQVLRDWRGDPAQAGGGALFEGGVHWVHFMANLGLTVRGVRGVRPGPSGVQDPERSMIASFDYAEGAVGTLLHSWEIRAPFGGVRLSGVYGTRGTAHFESNGLGVLLRTHRTRLRFPGLRDFLGFGAMWRDFVEALVERRAPRMTLDLAQRDLAYIEAAYGDDARGGVRRQG